MKIHFAFQIVFASIAGMVVAWIDSRPNWDDMALLVFMVFLSAFVFAYLAERKFWAIALAVSIWIPIVDIILFRNYIGVMALIPGFVGAWSGMMVRRIAH